MLGMLSIAVASAGFAFLVLLGAPRRPENRFLALFLLLIAGNQAFGIFWGLPDHPMQLLGFRLAAVCAALDPAALYCFAALHRRSRALWAPVPLTIVLGTGGAYAMLSAHLLPIAIADTAATFAYFGWAAYTAVVYTVVLVAMARGLVEGTPRPGADLLFVGLAIAAIPTWPRVFEIGILALHHLQPPAAALALSLGPALAVWVGLPLAGVLVALWLARRLPQEPRRVVAFGLAAGLVLAIVVNVARVLLAAGAQADGAWRPLFELPAYAVVIRWWLFGLLVSTAIVRDQLLGLSLAARRRAARVLVATGFLLLGVLVLALASLAWGDLLDPRPMDALVLAALLVASQRFHTLVDRVAARLYGVPLPGAAAAYAAYRSAARQAAHEPSTAEASERLSRLRGELGIDEDTARALEADARGEPGGPLVPGDRLSSRYEVGRLIARGGAGRVFAARDTLLGRDVVIKEVLHDDAGNEAAALGEARAAGALQHPNVLVVFDVLHRPGASYIIVESAEGGSLEDRLHAGPIEPDEALAILDGILAGLAEVHARGLLHRDLKPANVVLLRDGTPKLADFGLARLQRAPTLGAGGAAGTPAFLAPEQRAGAPASRASDVYAAGLIAQRLMTDPTPALARVIQQAVASDPAARWPDGARMRAALAQARGG